MIAFRHQKGQNFHPTLSYFVLKFTERVTSVTRSVFRSSDFLASELSSLKLIFASLSSRYLLTARCG